MKVSRRRQVEALRQLGLARSQRREFFQSEQRVPYYFPTTSGSAIALLQRAGQRLRSGIIEIDDPGSGIKNWILFQACSRRVALVFGMAELEIFGAAILDPRLEQCFLDWGYHRATDVVPDELGGGTMDIVTKIIPLSESNGGEP